VAVKVDEQETTLQTMAGVVPLAVLVEAAAAVGQPKRVLVVLAFLAKVATAVRALGEIRVFTTAVAAVLAVALVAQAIFQPITCRSLGALEAMVSQMIIQVLL
jgi:hypothetical protein